MQGALCALFLLQRVLPVAATASEVQPAAVHAARAALAAFADVEAIEASILADESVRMESARDRLQVGDSLQEGLAHFLEAGLSTVRHILATGLPEDTELTELAGFDRQLSDLLHAQSKEPLFFWHGPRRLILPRLKQLLDRDNQQGAEQKNLRNRLETLGSKRGASVSGLSETLRGLVEPTEVKQWPSTSISPDLGALPKLAIAVGDKGCGDGTGKPGSPQPPCDLESTLQEATSLGMISGTKQVHVLVLPCSKRTVHRIGQALRTAKASVREPFVSLVVDEAVVEDPWEIREKVTDALDDFGQNSLDLLWLPYAAFRKQSWPQVKELLEKLIEEGKLKAYGVHADMSSKVVVSKILDRKPTPRAWLAPHDIVRPIESAALAVAAEKKVAVVALPRFSGRPNNMLGVYLEAAVGEPSVNQEAAEARWVLGAGLSAVVELGTGSAGHVDTPTVLKQLQDIHISTEGSRLLALLQFFAKSNKSEPMSTGVVQGRGLISLLRNGREKASASKSEGMRHVAVDGKNLAVPGVANSTLHDLHAQKRQYKENDHVIYKENFFDGPTWSAIVEESKRLWRSTALEPNCNLDGKNRLGGYVLDHSTGSSSLYRLIYGNEGFRHWVSAVNDEGEMWPSDFPIELREYGTESQGMGCHPDLQMYAMEKKDLEFAVTVDNLSECNVTYWDAKGDLHLVKTRPNSVMMVRVNAATHCVSATNGGTRTILKFIYVGDYRKSREFKHYTDNLCGPSNPNVKALKERRESPVRPPSQEENMDTTEL